MSLKKYYNVYRDIFCLYKNFIFNSVNYVVWSIRYFYTVFISFYIILSRFIIFDWSIIFTFNLPVIVFIQFSYLTVSLRYSVYLQHGKHNPFLL